MNLTVKMITRSTVRCRGSPPSPEDERGHLFHVLVCERGFSHFACNPEALVTIHVTEIDDRNNGAMRHRFIGSRTVVENQWTEIHGTYVLDDLTGILKKLDFTLGGPPPGVNLLVDDVSVEPVNEAKLEALHIREGRSCRVLHVVGLEPRAFVLSGSRLGFSDRKIAALSAPQKHFVGFLTAAAVRM